MKALAIAFAAPLLLLGACTTTSEMAATPEQRATCQAMAQEMGTTSPHSHPEMKGSGPAPMTMTHDRCRKILAQRE